MKNIIVILLIFITSDLQAQFGIPTNITPFPNSLHALNGYPSQGYFKSLGKKYYIVNVSKEYTEEIKTSYYKSYFKFKNNSVRSKTVSSEHLFHSYRKFKIINNEIIECNRLGIPKKDFFQVKTRFEIIGSDSIAHSWDYYIKNGDTLIDRSYRETYDVKRKLIKREVAFDFFAYNDSTWKLAEKSSRTGGVQITKFKYIKDEELDIDTERITSDSKTSTHKTIYYKYDTDKKLIEAREFDKDWKKTFVYKYTYKNKICVLEEVFNEMGLIESTEVMAF